MRTQSLFRMILLIGLAHYVGVLAVLGLLGFALYRLIVWLA